MTDNPNIERQKQFVQHWQLWAALHHFLSAPLLRELLEVIVQQVNPRSVGFDQLFDHAVSESPEALASWVVRPRESTEPVEVYLQSRVHALLWQNDSACYVPSDPHITTDVQRATMLEVAIQVGSLDFGIPDSIWDRVQLQVSSEAAQRGFTDFIGVVRACSGTGGSLQQASPQVDLISFLDSLPPPLDALTAKHLGDLSADVDDWNHAGLLYDQAADRIAQPLQAWGEFQSLLTSVIIQSQAAAARHLLGAAQAEALLSTLLVEASSESNPVAVANAAIDARYFHYQASEALTFQPSHRSAVLLPPLLHRTHELSSALQAWLNDDIGTSQVQFWAVLRRQVALGSSIEAQETKAFYARSIVDRLDYRQAEKLSQDSFHLALRLIIQSGDARCAAAIRWHEFVVNRFVDEACASSVEQQATRYAASAEQRRHVVLVLFRSWCEQLAPDRAGAAHAMLRSLASIAGSGRTSLVQSRNLGGEAFEALTQIGKRRPDWCKAVAADVVASVVAKLTDPLDWSAVRPALDTSIAYLEADALLDDQLRGLVNCILSLTDKIPRQSTNWVQVRSSLTLLISAPVKRLATTEPSLGQRIVTTILRFGGPDAPERDRVMFYLHDFDPKLLADESIVKSLEGNVTELRRLARQTNASNVGEKILALLLAPAVSGRDGVKDAIDSFQGVIAAALAQRSPSMGLPQGYQALVLLADNQTQIAADLKINRSELQSWLRPLLSQVITLWNHAKERPELFSTFSLPPNERPNLVAVHNWTYASLIFAQSLGASDLMRAALDESAANPALSNAIGLGRSTRSLTQVNHEIDVDAILSENGQVFYDALGRRLALLRLVNSDQALALCKALLAQCFRHGPKILDAAVLLAASHLNLGDFIRTSDYANYTRKLDNDRDTKLALEPLIDRFTVTLPPPRTDVAAPTP